MNKHYIFSKLEKIWYIQDGHSNGYREIRLFNVRDLLVKHKHLLEVDYLTASMILDTLLVGMTPDKTVSVTCLQSKELNSLTPYEGYFMQLKLTEDYTLGFKSLKLSNLLMSDVNAMSGQAAHASHCHALAIALGFFRKDTTTQHGYWKFAFDEGYSPINAVSTSGCDFQPLLENEYSDNALN